MVKIIKRGDSETRQFTCPICKSIFTADAWDYAYDGFRYQIACPVCHKITTYHKIDVINCD